ncbi:MAG TPA: DUF4190 domain-containing protein [Bacteroidales bacterium]|jgi:hypothetical protein|nr:DUF4190 domain-containing protein [Bacteroidales bacterium]
MEEVKNNSGQNLGIAALITAIITFVLAVIPCVGLIALIPGIIAIILAAVGLSQASRSNSPRGLLLAGLIIAIIATLLSFTQVFIAGKIANSAGKWPNNIENIIKDVQDNVIKEMDDNNVNIKIESGDDVIEINATRKDKEKVLEGLEGDTLKNDTSQVKK